jgi:hypothetical protein
MGNYKQELRRKRYLFYAEDGRGGYFETLVHF